MKVPFLDLKANYAPLKEEIQKEIQDVLDNTAYILGPKVASFEKAFAEAHNAKHCFGVSSGTDGNHITAATLGITFGDEIIMPANTFIATAWGATLTGATPVFVDVDPESYNLDPAKVEAAITPKTKAIVAVHLYGQPADMDALKAIADKHNIYLIEDAAQAHLAEYKGKKVGSIGDAASFSFYPGKNLGAYGEAGAVTTNSDELAAKIDQFRVHGQSKKYYHETYGHNYRMSAIQGAVLGIKLKHLASYTENRRRVAKRYNELLADIEMIKLPKEMEYAKHVYHLYVIQIANREDFQKRLADKGVSSGMHYPVPLHLQNCFKHLGYKKGDFPVTEQLADNCVSLPMFPEMTDEQIEYVCQTIKEEITNLV